MATGNSELSVSLVKFGLAHGDFAIPFAALDVFLMKKFEGHADFLQLLMYVFIVRIAVHGLVRELLRIEEAIDLRFLKITDIVVADSFRVSDVKDFTDGMP